MNRFSLVCASLVVSAACCFDRVANAQAPEILQPFHIVPRHSVLTESGGFAGIVRDYRLIGGYDFHFSPAPWIGASFENAEVWGSVISDLPTPAVVLDVDELLNLEGLEGEQLPVAGPFDLFRFTGLTQDGSDITLWAAKLGRWMYVKGSTTPPPHTADFFEYDVRILARSGPFADFNHDGVVDARDYTMLRDSGADALDGAGWTDWRDQFGETLPDMAALDGLVASAAAGLSAGAPIPEPATAVLLLIGLGVVARRVTRPC